MQSCFGFSFLPKHVAEILMNSTETTNPFWDGRFQFSVKLRVGTCTPCSLESVVAEGICLKSRTLSLSSLCLY